MSKYVRRPSPWFTLWFLFNIFCGMPLLFIHILTFGSINGMKVIDNVLDYLITKDLLSEKN